MQPNILRRLAAEFLSNAISTDDTELKEGFSRSSIEKSYYYVFLVLRKSMREEAYQISDLPEAHREVIQGIIYFYGDSRSGRGFRKMMNSLRDERNKASYDIDVNITTTHANTVNMNATTLLNNMCNNGTLSPHILSYM